MGRHVAARRTSVFSPKPICPFYLTTAYYLASSVLAVRDLLPPTAFTFYVQPKSSPTEVTFTNAVGPQVQSTKKLLSVSLPYQGELRVEDARAMLIPTVTGAASFAPTSVSLRVSGASSQLVAVFPPIESLKFDGLKDADATTLKTPKGWRICAARDATSLTTCAGAVGATSDNKYYWRPLGSGYSEASAAEAPEFEMTASADAVTLATDGTLNFAVYVAPAKGTTVSIGARGGELIVGGSPIKEIKVSAMGMQPISVRNANPGGIVTLTGTSTAAADATVKFQKSVTIGVRAAPAASK